MLTLMCNRDTMHGIGLYCILECALAAFTVAYIHTLHRKRLSRGRIITRYRYIEAVLDVRQTQNGQHRASTDGIANLSGAIKYIWHQVYFCERLIMVEMSA